MPEALAQLSKLTSDLCLEEIDLMQGNVSRLDVVDDRFIAEDQVIAFFKRARDLNMTRMLRSVIGDTTVQFVPRAKRQNRQVTIYSKMNEILSRQHTEQEKMAARGQIRLEVTVRTSFIRELAERLGFSGRGVSTILTESVCNCILEKYRNLLRFDTLFEDQPDLVSQLLRGPMNPSLPLIGFVALQEKLGRDFFKSNPQLISKRRGYEYQSELNRRLKSL